MGDQNTILLRGIRRRLPPQRKSIRWQAQVGDLEVYLTSGEYDNGDLGEIFVDLHKPPQVVQSLMESTAIAVSMGLQYGVPLNQFVDTYTFPRNVGVVSVKGHAHITLACSVVDYVFRVLGHHYLGRDELVQISGPSQAQAYFTDEETGTVTRGIVGLDLMIGDAPFCDNCGTLTVNHKSGYKCLNCGRVV